MVNVAEDRNTPMEPSDEALCRRAADGSREAEEALVRRYSGLVRSCARPLFLAGGDSEDLIQEGMLGLFKAVRDYKPGRRHRLPPSPACASTVRCILQWHRPSARSISR